MEQILDDFSQENNDTLKDWATFVQSPHDTYYVEKWIAIEDNGKDSFNIGAFFFGAFWMLYRKMYKESIIVMMLILLETYLEGYIISIFEWWEYEVVLNLISSLTIATVIGFFGNRLYLNSTNQKIKELKVINREQSAYQSVLAYVGGTSWAAVAIGFSLYCLFFFILYSLEL